MALSMGSEDLPSGVSQILDYLAMMAKGYNNNRLQSQEVAKLKADLMNAPERWRGLSLEAITYRCSALGMRADDVSKIVDLISRAQSGRILRPQRRYRDYCFTTPLEQ